MTPQKLATGARFTAKVSIVCLLVSLVSTSGYGQGFTFDGDSKTRIAQFFGPGLRLTYPAGLASLTTLDSRFVRVPVTTVSWSAASMNPSTAVLPPTSASLSTHRKKTTTLRVIAGLLGAGLAGVGAYLVSTSEGASRVEICTLCSEPPVSQARLQLTGRQGAGIASIAAGAGLLAYAAF